MEIEQAFLFTGLIYQKAYEEKILTELTAAFGASLLESASIPFDFTKYYEEEMGKGLLRKWILFDTKIEQDSIADIKLKTIRIENEFSINNNRQVNIDPGYVTLSKVVLPTTKDCAHRIYLKDGIYAEITLLYRKSTWQPQSWTYRDYCTKTALDFFANCRKHILKKQEAM